MLKIRSYLFVILLCISMVIYWPIAVLGGLFLNELKAYYVATAWGRFSLILFKYVVGITYTVHNPENIPKNPTVVLSKHQSALDIFVLLTIFDPQAWVFKKEILSIPCFGWSLRATNPIAIDRADGRRSIMKVIERGIQKLKAGYFIIMYPEGTRVAVGEKGTYKGGGVRLAQKAGVDITPVALNTGLFWAKGKGLQKTGIIDIVIGEPIPTNEGSTDEILSKVSSWIEENTNKIVENHTHSQQQTK